MLGSEGGEGSSGGREEVVVGANEGRETAMTREMGVMGEEEGSTSGMMSAGWRIMERVISAWFCERTGL